MNQVPSLGRRFSATSALLLAALVAVAGARSGAAQEPRLRTAAGTGLYTLHPRHTVIVSIAELGGAGTEPTAVELRLLDGAGRVLRSLRGELRPDRPLRLRLAGPETGALALRAEAVLVTSTTNFGTAPVLTVEMVNDATHDAFASAACAVPYDPEGTGGKVLGDCGGCQVLIDFEP